LRNVNKQHPIHAEFFVNNASSIGNQYAKFQLNLSTQTIVTATFVRLLQNVKCPYSFSCLNSLIKRRSFAENTILLLFTLF